VPLLKMKFLDEISQIKFYAKTYYEPIFTDFELTTMNFDSPIDIDGAQTLSKLNTMPKSALKAVSKKAKTRQERLSKTKEGPSFIYLAKAKRPGTCTRRKKQQELPIGKEVEHLGSQLHKLHRSRSLQRLMPRKQLITL